MFTHLHFHTAYSFLDGYNPIKKAVARVKDLGMVACAITDHNHLCGVPEWQEECMKAGIKPLLGLEGYYTNDISIASLPIEERREKALIAAIEAEAIPDNESYINKLKKKELNELVAPYMYDMRQYHILYIAKNLTGWHNLVKLQSESARLCTYNGRYLADIDLIKKYHEGIICTTACVGSYPSHMIQDGNTEEAKKYVLEMKEIFGDDFYLEIQPINIEKQHITNYYYIKWSKELDIKLIATNDVHYTLKSDYDDHDTLLCIGTGAKKSDTNRMRYSNDFWIKSRTEMIDSFGKQEIDYAANYNTANYLQICTEAIDNTQLIVDKCDDYIPLGSDKPLFSKVKVPHNRTPEQQLQYMAWKGLYKYLKERPECNKKTYVDRLNMELAIICYKGFAPYFLAVEEYVTWANEHNCPTGPGRGSAAGSLVLFCIGITKNIDPIKNQLLFSRFLTKDRKDMPDCKLVA